MNKIARLLLGINRPRLTSVLYVWGRNDAGQLGIGSTSTSPVPFTQYDNITSWRLLRGGTTHTLGIKSDDTLWAWGSNTFGELGLGNTVARLTPGRVGNLKWSTVSAQGSSSAGITADGLLFTWGNNVDSQLGDGTSIWKSSPVQIGSSSWTQVSVGINSMGAIRSDGLLFMWGTGSSGQLGQATNISRNAAPTLVGGQTVGATATATVNTQTSTILGPASLTASTTLSSGTNDDGFWNVALPWPIDFLGTSYTNIFVGTNSYITFGSGATVYSGLGASTPNLPKIMIWAADRSGQRIYSGIEGTVPNRTFRIRFEGSTGTSGTIGSPTHGYEATFYEATPSRIDINMFAGSLTGVAGIYTASTAVATFTTSQLSLTSGVNFTTNLSGGTLLVPQSWSQVSIYDNYTLAIRSDSTLWSWGLNSLGQLGDNTIISKSSPVQIGTSSWTAIHTASALSLAIRNDGTLWGWGLNGDGRVGDGTLISKSSPVQIGSDSWAQLGGGTNHTLAIRSSDRTLWGWGTNTTGELLVNSAVSSWTTLAAGATSMLAIKQDGTLWSWGFNFAGQLGTNDRVARSSPVQIGTNSWSQVAVGGYDTGTSLAIRADGTMWGWGTNALGQVGDGTVINRSSPVQIGVGFSWTNISAGYHSNMAIRSDGTLWAWGWNTTGQVGDNTSISKSSPVQIGVGFSWTQLATGSTHSLATRSDGTLWGWGDDFYGQVGKIENFSSIDTWNRISTRSETQNTPVHAIRSDGSLWTWGGDTSANSLLMSGTGGALTTTATSPFKVGNDSWTQITTAQTAVYGIHSNNSLLVWGFNNGTLGTGVSGVNYSVPTVVSAPTTFTQISSGLSHTLAIAADGTLWGWGDNTRRQLSTMASSPTYSWSQVSVGSSHTVAIRSDGTLWAWGLNDFGQLGHGTVIQRFSPVQVGTSSWSQVAVGLVHTVAIRSDGTLWSWGYNSAGGLGDGTRVDRSSPVQIGSANTWSVVAASNEDSAAIRSDGTLWAWGRNNSYQLGDGTFANRSSPVQIGVESSWTFVSKKNLPGAYAIKSDGTLWAWGTGIISNSPRRSWTQLAASRLGYFEAFAGINHIGELYIAGPNSFGVITGAGGNARRYSLTKHNNNSWSQVAVGDGHILAVRSDGTLWSWGQSSSALGYDTSVGGFLTNGRSSPTQIGTGTNWAKVFAGGDNGGFSGRIKSYATRTDGSLWGWGYRIGDGLPMDNSLPAQIGAGISWSHISAGRGHTLGIGNGNLYGWGDNENGQLGIPLVPSTRPTSWSQITAGASHALAIGSDGSLWAWGHNTFGQLGTNSTTSSAGWPIKIGSNSWSQINATVDSTVAIRNDGTMWAWGLNNNGQVGDGTVISRSSPVQIGTNNNWSAINGHGNQVLAIRTNGTLWTWGNNSSGQLGDGTTVNRSSPVQIGTDTNWSKVAAGSYFSLALKSTGTLWAWGGNTYGNLGDNTTISKSSPIQIGTSSWTHIAAADHALASIGTQLYAWGDGSYNNYGTGFSSSRSSPVAIGAAFKGGDQFLATKGATVYQRSDNSIRAYGYVIEFGSGGTGISGSYVIDEAIAGYSTAFIPVAASKSNSIQRYSILYRNATTSALGATGEYFEQLGFGSRTFIAPNTTRAGGSSTPDWFGSFDSGPHTPTLIASGSWNYAEAGNAHSVAVRSDGTLWTWGLNTNGQLGDGTVISKSSPVQIGSFTNWRMASASDRNTLAIRTDGSLYTWGWSNGASFSGSPLGDGLTGRPSRSSPVQIGATLDGVSITYQWATFNDHNRQSTNSDPDMLLIGNDGSVLGLDGVGGRGFYSTTTDGSTQGGNFEAGGQFSGAWTMRPTYFDGQLLYPVRYPEPIPATPGSFVFVDAGSGVAGAITTSTVDPTYGTTNNIRLWGYNSNNVLGTTTNAFIPYQLPPALTGYAPWTSLSIGFSNPSNVVPGFNLHAISNNVLFGLGYNFEGAVGDGTTIDRSTLTIIGAGRGWSKVVESTYRTVAAIANDGTLWLWGQNDRGQIGDTTTSNRSSPVLLAGQVFATVSTPMQLSTESWSQISSGTLHSLAIKSNNTLWGWGTNVSGLNTNRVVDGSLTTTLSSPVQVLAGNSVTSVSTSETITTAINSANVIWAWGTTAAGSFSPTVITTSVTDPLYVSAGTRRVAITGANGQLYEYGTTTTNNTFTAAGLPVPKPRDSESVNPNWSQAGRTTYSANTLFNIDTNNNLYTLGDNTNGKLAIGRTTAGAFGGTGPLNFFSQSQMPMRVGGYGIRYSSPVQIGTDSWTQISAGSQYSLGLSTTGSLYSWGDNFYGSLGVGWIIDSSAYSKSSPVQVGTDSWTQISAGSFAAYGIKSNNTLWAWSRDNQSGELGIGTVVGTGGLPAAIGNDSWSLISASKYEARTVDSPTFERDFAAAIRTNGTLYMWGENNFGQLGKGNVIFRSSPVLLGNDPVPNVITPTLISSASWSIVSAGHNGSSLGTRTI